MGWSLLDAFAQGVLLLMEVLQGLQVLGLLVAVHTLFLVQFAQRAPVFLA